MAVHIHVLDQDLIQEVDIDQDLEVGVQDTEMAVIDAKINCIQEQIINKYFSI
jgi:hypothetical protein